MAKRPISEKTKRRYALAGMNKIKKLYPKSRPLLSHLDKLKTQLRNAAKCKDPERKKRIEAASVETMAAIELIVADGGVFSHERHIELQRSRRRPQ